MRILFDLDDTLIIGDVVEKISTEMVLKGELDHVYTNSDVHSYDMLTLPPNLREKVLHAFTQTEYAVERKRPMDGVLYFLNYLNLVGHELGTLTARPAVLESSTIHYLKKYFRGIPWKLGNHFCNVQSSINMSAPPTKAEILKKIKPDIYYDDNLEYCKQSATLGIKTVLISNSHTPWNHGVSIPHVISLKNPAFTPFEWVINEPSKSKNEKQT